jgi:transcription-repair coupling factor (superfamily II helicase)
VINLLFQMKVKLLAEQAHLASVSLESGQLVLRYPPLPEGVSQRNLPMIGLDARAGKNAYWMPFDAESMDWQQKLVESLTELVHLRSG